MSETQGFDKARRELVSAGRNLWLASLGAVAKAEEEGRELFDRLVERGRPLEERQRHALDKMGDRTNETVRELRKLVQDTMEYETKGVLKRFGMMTKDDVKILAARLATLSHKLDELAARQEPALEQEPESATVSAPKERRPRQRKP
ncbi:MAG TPA: phasin family protein [Thermoanaerobaculia bacterium]|jgi:poly(hydroxyalkanoate) granule-associated protein|nr:phasin family protein [Thermoanaerobaculia bacterium]